MSDIKKLMNIITEMGTCAGSVASVAMPIGGVQRRAKTNESGVCEMCKSDPCACQTHSDETDAASRKAPDAPKASTFGLWKNSVLAGAEQRDKKRAKSKVKESKSKEKIDEISSKLAGDYYGAATKKHVDKVGMRPNMYNRIEKDMGTKRKQGMDRAFDRITRDDKKVAEDANDKQSKLAELEQKLKRVQSMKGSIAAIGVQDLKRKIAKLKSELDVKENFGGGMRDRPGPEHKQFDMAESVNQGVAEGTESEKDQLAKKIRELLAAGKDREANQLRRKLNNLYNLEKNKQGVAEDAVYNSQYKSREDAIAYAKEKVKSFRDHFDGIEIWELPDGGFDVVHTMNSNGRNHVIKNGGKKIGTIYRKKLGSKSVDEMKYGAGQRKLNLAEEDLEEEQVLPRKKGKELFKKSKDRDIGKRPKDREITTKESSNYGDLDEYAGQDLVKGLKRAIKGKPSAQEVVRKHASDAGTAEHMRDLHRAMKSPAAAQFDKKAQREKQKLDRVNKTIHEDDNDQPIVKKKVNRKVNESFNWTKFFPSLKMSERMNLLETYLNVNKNLFESNDKTSVKQFLNLKKYSLNPSLKQKYLTILLGLVNDRVMILNDPEVVTVINKRENIYNVKKSDGTLAEYPSREIRENLVVETLFFDNSESYNKFRTMLGLSFDIGLADVNIEELLNKSVKEGSMKSATHKPEGPKFGGYWKGSDKGPPKPGQGVGACESVEMKEVAPPGKEDWIKKNKARFKKEYGSDKGERVLYATAWKNKGKK